MAAETAEMDSTLTVNGNLSPSSPEHVTSSRPEFEVLQISAHLISQ